MVSGSMPRESAALLRKDSYAYMALSANFFASSSLIPGTLVLTYALHLRFDAYFVECTSQEGSGHAESTQSHVGRGRHVDFFAGGGQVVFFLSSHGEECDGELSALSEPFDVSFDFLQLGPSALQRIDLEVHAHDPRIVGGFGEVLADLWQGDGLGEPSRFDLGDGTSQFHEQHAASVHSFPGQAQRQFGGRRVRFFLRRRFVLEFRHVRVPGEFPGLVFHQVFVVSVLRRPRRGLVSILRFGVGADPRPCFPSLDWSRSTLASDPSARSRPHRHRHLHPSFTCGSIAPPRGHVCWSPSSFRDGYDPSLTPFERTIDRSHRSIYPPSAPFKEGSHPIHPDRRGPYTPMPLFGRVSPRGSRAASWSIPHVLGLPQHDFRCSFRWCGSRVQDSRP
eukprot:scaffold316_cov352-Pavlova_lutheri.AAC.45